MTKKTVILRAVLPLTLFILHGGWLPGSLQAQTPIATAFLEISGMDVKMDPKVATPMVSAANAYPLFDGFTLDSLIVGHTYTIRSNTDDPHYADFVEKLTGTEPIMGALGVMELNAPIFTCPDPPLPDTLCGNFYGRFKGGGSSSGNMIGYFQGWFDSASFQTFFVPSNSLLGATVGSISLTVNSLEIGIIDQDTGRASVNISFTLSVFAGGACCNIDGTCTDGQTQTDCEAKNGVYGGDSSHCAETVCALAGACCDGETCTKITKAACDKVSGAVWLGGNTICSPVNPCLTGACCEAITAPPLKGGISQTNGTYPCRYTIASDCTGRWNPALTCDDSTCDPTPGACFVDGKCENLPRIDCFGQWHEGRCPAPVPTMTEYGLALFSIMLIGSATIAINRRKRSS
jgi:hypothetical protein